MLASDDEDDDKIEDLCCRHENGEDEESLNLSNVTTFSTIERRAKVQHFDELVINYITNFLLHFAK